MGPIAGENPSLAFALPLPPMVEATLLSATEHGEMPSIALAASRRSSKFLEDGISFPLFVFQDESILVSILPEAAVEVTLAEGVIEYAAFAISMME